MEPTEAPPQCTHTQTTVSGRTFRCVRDPHPENLNEHYMRRADIDELAR